MLKDSLSQETPYVFKFSYALFGVLGDAQRIEESYSFS